MRWRGRQQVIDFGGAEIRSAIHEVVHIDAILEAHAAAGVDRVVLSPWTSLLHYEVDVAKGLDVSRVQNDALAKLVQTYPEQVSALGTVPLQAPDLAARELDALMDGSGLCGVEVAASVQGTYLGDDRFRPVWDVAEATGALVFVHPTTRGFGLPVLQEYYLWNSVGNPMETTIAAAHLIMAGVMETHPRFKVLLAHGGGALAALRGRLRHAHTVQSAAQARLRESPEASLARFYFDTVTHDAHVLRELVDVVGVEHVLLGSDYPFDMGVAAPTDVVRALHLPHDDEAKILGGNAARLLGIPC